MRLPLAENIYFYKRVDQNTIVKIELSIARFPHITNPAQQYCDMHVVCKRIAPFTVITEEMRQHYRQRHPHDPLLTGCTLENWNRTGRSVCTFFYEPQWQLISIQSFSVADFYQGLGVSEIIFIHLILQGKFLGCNWVGISHPGRDVLPYYFKLKFVPDPRVVQMALEEADNPEYSHLSPQVQTAYRSRLTPQRAADTLTFEPRPTPAPWDPPGPPRNRISPDFSDRFARRFLEGRMLSIANFRTPIDPFYVDITEKMRDKGWLPVEQDEFDAN